MKIGRITQDHKDKIIRDKKVLPVLLVAALESMKQKIMEEYLNDDRQLSGCFFKVMEELIEKSGKAWSEDEIQEVAADKFVNAGAAIFEAVMLGAILRQAHREGRDQKDAQG